MSKGALTNAYILLNTVDLSDHIETIRVFKGREEIDITCMGDAAVARTVGIEDWSIELTFRQDYAASEVDATVYAVYNGGVGVAVVVKAVNATTSATNPKWSGTGMIFEYTPIDGGIGGGAHNVPVTIKASAGSVLARTTSD